MSQEFLTTREFAKKTGLSASTISNWLRSGKLQGMKEGRKWMIPADQLKFGPAAAKPTTPNKPVVTIAEAGPPPTGPSYSVSEFAAMTYLTELGVQRWLQEKLLEGFRQADGEWRVYALNLNNPKVSRLLRK